jgi:hypothetical protein
MEVDSEQAKIPSESQFSPRAKWKYSEKASEYHRRHKYARYTMDFVSTLEAEMCDASLSKEHRVLAAIKRFSWGNLSDVPRGATSWKVVSLCKPTVRIPKV